MDNSIVPDLYSDAQLTVNKLKSAIVLLNNIKKRLQTSTHLVKSQIHSCMSRQLESLRSRELWLLNQVDLVSSAKNEVLRQQRETINELCSKIDSIVQHKNLDESMLPTLLNEATDMDLTLEQDAHMAFHVDVDRLQEAIFNFGKISGTPEARSFMSERTIFQSPSLPNTFEDYEDVDQQILYKPLKEQCQEIKEEINVCLPDIPDSQWLSSTSKLSRKSDRPSGKPVSLGSWLSKERTSGDVCNWLATLKVSPEVEEEASLDFEIIASNPDCSKISDDEPTEVQKLTIDHMNEIFESPSSLWLSSAQADVMDVQEEDPFSHISKDATDWLSCSSVDILQACKSNCAEKRRTFDIENLDKMNCIQTNTAEDLDKDVDDRCACAESLQDFLSITTSTTNLKEWLSSGSSKSLPDYLTPWLSSSSGPSNLELDDSINNLKKFHQNCSWILGDSETDFMTNMEIPIEKETKLQEKSDEMKKWLTVESAMESEKLMS